MRLNFSTLSIKWRPNCFKNLVGQNHIKSILKFSIDKKKLHHVYLFSGPSGVGKTSLARIFAKSLNCVLGVIFNFCNICNSCKSIDSNSFSDYIEIDASNNRNVDNISILFENLLFKPLIGRYKIYVIDEFHMLSNYSFNLLLKILEESPYYIKFILITTCLDKIPINIFSRCMHLNFRNISNFNIIFYISKKLIKKKIFFKKDALLFISNLSLGNLRTAISITQKSISYTNSNINLKFLSKMLCIVDEVFIIKLFIFIYKSMNNFIINYSNFIKKKGFSFSQTLLSLIFFIHKTSLLQFSSKITLKEYKYKKKVLYFSKVLNPERIHLLYQIAVCGYNDLSSFSNEYIIFTMTLLKMVLFKPIFIFN